MRIAVALHNLRLAVRRTEAVAVGCEVHGIGRLGPFCALRLVEGRGRLGRMPCGTAWCPSQLAARGSLPERRVGDSKQVGCRNQDVVIVGARAASAAPC